MGWGRRAEGGVGAVYLLLLTSRSSGQDGSFFVKTKSVHLLFKLILGNFLTGSFEITWDTPQVHKAGLSSVLIPPPRRGAPTFSEMFCLNG